MSNFDNNQELLELFKAESGENIALAESALLKLEKNRDPRDSVDELFRAIHTIKGSAVYLGFEHITEVSHAFENVLDSLRKSQKLTVSKKQIDIFFEVLNLLNFFVSDAPQFVPQCQGPFNQVMESLKTFQMPGESSAKTQSSQQKPATDSNSFSSTLGMNNSFDVKTVRVDQDSLDSIVNLVGELIVIRNAFSHIQGKFSSSEQDYHEVLKELRDSSGRLTHITGELQRNIMGIRMVPIRNVFQRYPRIVRDICRKTDKNVEIYFEGEETEIDRGIADLLTDPLVHIVRNAVDHGIENPEIRTKAGKTAEGTLTMKAFHQGNFMVIEVMDDGGGISLDKVRSKIIEKGLLSNEEAHNLTKSEAMDFIFHPGFSTAAAITDISGRGVGLDVVRNNLKKIKGNVSVTSEPSQGTCFRLEVPLTMAIMRAILVKENNAIYAVSLQDVRETVKVYEGDLKTIHQQKALSLRGEVIVVERLSELLGQHKLDIVPSDSKLSVLILEVAEKRFGLIVDSVYRQEEIVIKPLPDSYAGLKGLAGASILGDGKAILILDSSELQELINHKSARKIKTVGSSNLVA